MVGIGFATLRVLVLPLNAPDLESPTVKLLNVNANAKTDKSLKHGVLTGVMYLAPSNFARESHTVCALAKLAGCEAACLYSAGRGRFTATQEARIRKTKFWLDDPEAFKALLVRDIESLIRKAEREGLTPAVRLNGTSDIRWERKFPEVFERFADVQFYDYTKIPHRGNLPSNYHLTWSYSGANERYAAHLDTALQAGMNAAVVFRRKTKRGNTPAEALPETWAGRPVVDGDEHDFRPLDPKGVIVGLRAKGDAVADTSGFVVDA